MKKLLLFILLFAFTIYGQTEWTKHEDILTSNGNYYRFSDSDSVFASSDGDTLYIFGNDTIEIYINLGRTLGAVRYLGYAQGIAIQGQSATTCTLYFDVSIHNGDGSSMNSNITETFYAMDSVKLGAAAIGSFNVYPLGESNLNKRTAYYTLRIYGIAAQTAKIWLKEERINAY